MQRGPDCLSGSQATQNWSASTRSPIPDSDKPACAATIFNQNGAPRAAWLLSPRKPEPAVLTIAISHRAPSSAGWPARHPETRDGRLTLVPLIARSQPPPGVLIAAPFHATLRI